MKILVVCQYYYPEPFRVSDICETLVQQGHEITVLTGLPNYPEGRVLDEYRSGKKRKEILKGVKVIRNFEIGRGSNQVTLFLNYLSFTLSASLKAYMMKEEFDAVFVNQLSPVLMGIPAMVYKKKHQKKILLYCLDLWPDSLAAGGIKEDTILYKLFFTISKWIYSSADIILVTSSMFKDYFQSTLKLKIENIEYLPQYAEDLFTKDYGIRNGVITLGLKDSDKNFVFAGNIGDMQSVETIIMAANELKAYSNIVFHIVGDGSKLDICRQLSDELGILNIIFYGRKPVDEMPFYFEIADAMIITLKDNRAMSYTLPGKVQSYMAAGKPIIGSINGETQRIIAEAGCGLCCAAEDYKGLATLILQFCNSNQERDMGERARKFYIDNFSKERFMTRLDEILINLGG